MNPEQQLSDALGSRGKPTDPAPIGFEEVTRRADEFAVDASPRLLPRRALGWRAS